MSEGHISSDLETLFSFELLVEHIRIEEEENVSDELALAVRLLDFPTLLIYQSELRGDEMTPQNGKRGKRTFNRGVGKTTLVQKACDALVSSGAGVEGFYTEEVREGGRRVGFDVVTVSGERSHLSRIRDVAGAPHGRREYTVGQYVVDLPSFENLALPLFRKVGPAADGGSGKVFVIDEIGKMELFSQSFIRAVRQTLDSPSCTVLGTIPVPKGKPLALVEEVRSRRDVKVFTVSKENRNAILQDILSTLQECVKTST